MRTIALLCLIVVTSLLLTGCAQMRQRAEYNAFVEQQKAKEEEWKKWDEMKVAELKAGTLKRSDFFKQAYQKASTLWPNDDVTLNAYNELIKVARIYEAGKITGEQYEEKTREIQIVWTQEQNRRKEILRQRAAQAQYQQAQLDMQQQSLWLQYFQTLQNQINAYNAANRTNFTTTNCSVFGNQAQCTSW